MIKLLLDPYYRSMHTLFYPEDLERLKSLVDIIWGKDRKMPKKEWKKAKQEASIIVTGFWRYGSIDKENAPNLKAIIEVSGQHPSPKMLDYDTCFKRNIRVLSCAPAFAPMVAEMGLGLAISAARDIVAADRSIRLGTEKWQYMNVATLYDQIIGIIGYGNLARALKPLLDPFRCKIQAYDPWLPISYLKKQGVSSVSLEHLLKTSKIIFVLAVPSAENKALLSREMLKNIQNDAILILLSRAHLIDFDALIEFTNENRFKAAVDVFPIEPLPKGHPVRKAKNMIITPHLAGSALQARRNIGRMVTDDVEAISMGLPPMNLQVAQQELINHFN
jgi:phosphoglycerate dehydrogenase-like enzyme